MKNLKKLGIVPLSTVLSLGLVVPTVGAAAPANEHQDRPQIRIAAEESTITKNDLIKKVKTLFPGKFDFLTDRDFHMSSGHYFPEDGTVRYDLSFHKEVSGKSVYGSFGFVGKDLKLEHFYYEPISTSDSLFPPEVTKKEAEEMATAFLNRFADGSEYILDQTNDVYPGGQTLIQPIRYSFSFAATKGGIPVSDQMVQISVLGNGEVVEFYHQYSNLKSPTFDSAENVLPENEVLTKLKENLAIDLQYQVDFDWNTGDPYVQIVYQPSYNYGVHALTGQWQTADGFSDDAPKQQDVQLITDEPLAPRETDFTVEKAKAFAQEFLAPKSGDVKLRIEAIEERENYKGQQVISVMYMYENASGGYGADFEFDRETGDIVQYYNIDHNVTGSDKNNGSSLSRAEALEQAVEYLKEYSPSYLHEYAMPREVQGFEGEPGVYYFAFPRVVDGIIVNGDQIMVSVATDGSLVNLSVDKLPIEDWPSRENIISKEEATEQFLKEVSADLRYVREGMNEEDNHYNLVYSPVYNGKFARYIDAQTGEWNQTNDSETVTIKHPWAEDELNYLISTGILTVEDAQSFNANEELSKGEALELLMKSLTPIYQVYYAEKEDDLQSYENIDSDHPLYLVVERAVAMGILKPEEAAFDEEAALTREELAVWYVRALGLEQAAKHSNIYQLGLKDRDQIQEKYTGHVALANSMGLVTASNGRFNPDGEVTYAQAAVSIFRLAKEVYEKNPYMYY